MMKQVLPILIALIAISKISFAQDTTGGTRANIVIPLHKSPAQSKVTPPPNGEAYTLDTFSKSPPVNSDDRRLRRAAANHKRAKAKSNKTTKP